ncbi:TetR/AcrR family transcriptional regulator [Gordonia oryzae]|uniref:TetR/AcrR family transcriptional regulator n=1 Tax=Gordonia oryzae TaxID=2487349 RepID=UPI001621D85E|nr:TetR/AcrR family transcriptional regulator [Gordonia oryzae]
MSAPHGTKRAKRVRDPERGLKILSAAATLFADRGFHAVSLGEIGSASGIVGSGIYRHFDNKYAVLVALLDKAISDLLDEAEQIADAGLSSSDILTRLVHQQINFCIDRRLEVQLYRQEISSLNPEDARRLKRMQRRYNEEWIATLLETRPELDEANARAMVYSAIGAIQSIVNFDSGLPREALVHRMDKIARACLFVA